MEKEMYGVGLIFGLYTALPATTILRQIIFTLPISRKQAAGDGDIILA
jgi:hypothetical protein